MRCQRPLAQVQMPQDPDVRRRVVEEIKLQKNDAYDLLGCGREVVAARGRVPKCLFGRQASLSELPKHRLRVEGAGRQPVPRRTKASAKQGIIARHIHP